MKVRTGFVSNSSSSSFCILGYAFDTSEFFDRLSLSDEKKAKILKEANEDHRLLDKKDEEGDFKDFEEAFEVLDKNYELYELVEALGLDAEIDSECDIIYVGSSFEDLGDDETGGEFKKRIAEEVGEILTVNDLKPCIITEEIYN